MKSLKIILVILFTCQLINVKGQTEFLVTVNPATGIHTIIDSLPGVNWITLGATTFDKNNHRYIFYGIDFSGNYRLYCIDALSGAILSQPTVPTLNLGEFQYDNSSNTLYSLYLNNGYMFLASLDISTASPTIIDTLPVVGYSSNQSFFDESNHKYVFQFSGSFYSTDVNTGTTSSSPAPTTFCQIQFDNLSGNTYGLIMGTSMLLVKIDTSNGTYIPVDTLPVNSYISEHLAFDENNHLFVFGSSDHLFSIDVNTGSIVSSPLFPVISPGENVIELNYDNSSGTLYSLHWGAVKPVGYKSNPVFDDADYTVFPNPVSTNLFINLNEPKREININIYSSAGKFVSKLTYFNSQFLVIRKENLSAGTYFISIVGDKKYLGTKKIIVK